MIRFMIILFLAVVVCLGAYYSVVFIPDGKVGVLVCHAPNLNRLCPPSHSLMPGIHLTRPFVSQLRLYDTRMQILLIDVPLGGTRTARFTAQVRLNSDSAVWVDRNMGQSYMHDKVRPHAAAVLEKESYRLDGCIVSEDGQQQVIRAIGEALSRDGVFLDEAVLTRLEKLEFSDEDTDEEASDTRQVQP